ncbi:hypothetical protein ABQJ54_17755 [Rhodanobacter sp. Si-c]|uniref:Secreted protein n=1 Tax=Rhodanobacter lycopersici TaxID=3162487 RepID=A0ABV3QID3_9GAMM
MFTLLVRVPILLAAPSASQWSEFVIYCALTAGGWVVTDSCRGISWLAVGRRRCGGACLTASGHFRPAS